MVKKSGEKEYLYIAGGLMEIQPGSVNIMADEVIRANDIDQQEAKKAIAYAEQYLNSANLAQAHKIELELIQAIAKLRVVESARRHLR